MRHAPTLTFVPDALPENARHLDEVLARAKAARRGGRRAAAARRTPARPTRTRSPRARTTTRTRPRTRVTADSGLVVVDKPAGMTSHDVVARVRRLAGTRKVGHAGTLDPMATGVLVLGVNRATRLLGHLTLTEKAYDATVRLGVATTTDDAEGEVVATRPTDGLDRGDGPRRRWRRSSARSSRCRPPSPRSRSTASAPTQRVRAARRSSSPARRVTVHALDGARRASRRRAPRRRRLACAARAAPTSARSPATSAPRSGSAAT